MSKFYRVWSGSIEGRVFTESAFKIVETLDLTVESKVISSIEIAPEERIYDTQDLAELGYEVSELTEQSDDNFFDTVDEFDETNPDFDLESDDNN
jgi:hypothetical protein